MQFVDERDAIQLRKCSMQMRENFLKNEVDAGESVVAVYCGERDPVGFWLARVEAESNKSNAVLHTATKADPNWDIRKGDKILNVTWLNRVSDEQPRKFNRRFR